MICEMCERLEMDEGSLQKYFCCVRRTSGGQTSLSEWKLHLLQPEFFSVLIGILVRQRSRVQKENNVLLAHSDEIPPLT